MLIAVLVILSPILMAAGVLLLGYVYQILGARGDARRFAASARRLSVGGSRLHVVESGTGSPAVIFESALGATSLSWTLVQPQVARLTRTLSYDRHGCGWSEPTRKTRDAVQTAAELHQLLERSGIGPPYILVGHSYGGFPVMRFAHDHPEQVAGLLLLDAADPEQWVNLAPPDRRKIAEGARLARRGSRLARFGVARLVVWLGSRNQNSPVQGLSKFITRGIPPYLQERLISPMRRLAPEAREQLKWLWTYPHFFDALARQIESVPRSAQQILDVSLPTRLPLVVVSAPNEDPRWLPQQRKLAGRSERGRHILAQESGHWIPLDAPDLVVRILREMIHEARQSGTTSIRKERTERTGPPVSRA